VVAILLNKPVIELSLRLNISNFSGTRQTSCCISLTNDFHRVTRHGMGFVDALKETSILFSVFVISGWHLQ